MPLPTHISEATRRLNPHLFGVAPGPHAVTAAKKIVKQHQGDGMNNWEREYFGQLLAAWPHVYREVSLPLANGLRYKVDFIVARTANGLEVEGHEVKGRPRAAGIAKVKMAARLYPWIRFILATKRRKRDGGGWAMEPVLP